MHETHTTDARAWWGTFSLPEGTAGRWRVGPSTLWLHHAVREWRIVHAETHDPLDNASSVAIPAPPGEAEDALADAGLHAELTRYSFEQADDDVHLTPVLPDRPLVVRPETPLYVLAGEAVTLYVSVPLWMRVEVGTPPRLLAERPAYRPPDTWFGPSTRVGELCYGSRTAGRQRMEDLPFRLHRAVTPLHVRNRAGDALLLERIQLPVAYLSLYRADNDFLWTQPVTLERPASGDLAALELGAGAPPEAAGAVLLRGPREEPRKHHVMHTFSTLFK